MKKKFLLLITAMLAAMLLAGVGIVSVSAQSVDNDPIIVDLGDFGEGTPTHWGVQNNCGQYSIEAVEDTVALKLNEDDSDYGMFHIGFEFKNGGVISADHKYVRITYMTDTTVEGKLMVEDFIGNSYTFPDDISVSDGEWTITKAIEIDNATITRLNNPPTKSNHLNIKFDTTDTNANYYIKEIAFFTSEEQANAYYNGGRPIIVDLGDTTYGEGTPTHWGVQNNCGQYSIEDVDGTVALKLNKDVSDFGIFHIGFEFKNGGVISADHKYVRITYMTDTTAEEKLIVGDFSTNSYTFAYDISVSGGEWTRTNAIEITDYTIQRLNNPPTKPNHLNIEFDTADTNANYYLKKIAFFTSEEQAYGYYGDEPAEKGATSTKMTFNAGGNAYVRYDAPDSGTSVTNQTTGAVDITYSPVETEIPLGSTAARYLAKLKFYDPKTIDEDQRFMRILYAAEQPEGVGPAELVLFDHITEYPLSVSKEIKDTGGEFVLTPTVQLPESFVNRLGGYNDVPANHVSLTLSTTEEGCTYSIKNIYFFNNKEAADAFTPPERITANITINGNNIDLYQIVISKNASYKDLKAAEALRQQINYISGVDLNIAKDIAPISPYEILVGQSNRVLSYAFMDEYDDGNDYAKRYLFEIVDNTLVLTAGSPAALESAVNFFNTNYFYAGYDNYPTEIAIDESCNDTGIIAILSNAASAWATVKNVASPATFTEKFYADTGYFVEHSNDKDTFFVKNGALTASAEGHALTYMQVYEKNATASAEFKFANAADDSDFGLMLRYVGSEAFLKGGYDFAKDQWYISFREGEDFYEVVCASASTDEELDPAKTYTVSLTADGSTAALSVNGEEILTADGINHVTPGRPGIFAENIDIAVDNYELTLLSGMGKIMRNVIHTYFSEKSSFHSSVTFVEMNDGSINAGDLKSTDGGKTWTYTGDWTELANLDHFIRLNDGRLANVAYANSGYNLYISEDEGVTWVKQGRMLDGVHPTYPEFAASQQNDKLTQGPSGRMYYSANFEASTDVTFDDGVDRLVFSEFYYSNDLGETWNKSNFSSIDIEGNEQAYKFAECKLIEVEDYDDDDIVGDCVRIYCSWSDYGCIVYSDSTDGGENFGPLQMLTVPGTDDEYFRCARSSMQLTRDMYGETDYTYYMVWVNAFDNQFATGPKTGANMPRNGLSLAKSTDGKNWEYLGDIWRWESAYTEGLMINHIVNPSIATTKDSILVGTGLSEYLPREGDPSVGQHGAQRQHVWSIARVTLEGEFKPFDLNDDEEDLVKLTNFSRAIAKWNGYSMDSYADYKANCDLNRDGKLNSIDLIIYTRHIADWDGYDTLPFNP